MALPLSNSFETGLADETTITVGNSNDGDAGNAFDEVILNAQTGVFDTAQVAHGSLALRIVTAASPASIHFGWTTSMGTQTEIWGRAYFYKTSNPTSHQWPLRFFDSVGSQAGLIYWGSGGEFFVFNADNTVNDSGVVGWQLNQWNRIEFHLVSSTTVGSLEAFLYDADSTTPFDSASISGTNTRANVAEVYFGDISGLTASNTTWVDDVQVGLGFPGPALEVANLRSISSMSAVGW